MPVRLVSAGFERPMRRRVLVLIAGILPVIVIATIWYPYASHFYIRGEEPAPEVVDELRRRPLDALLQELAQQDVVSNPILELERDPVKTATELIQGRI